MITQKKSEPVLRLLILLFFVLLLTIVITNRIYAYQRPAWSPAAGPIVQRITINTATEQLIAFDANGEPLKVISCSTGARGNTTVGVYRTSNYYLWRQMKGNVWSRYAIRFNGRELIHSVPYYRRTKDSLEYKQYNRLGTPASAGCCRVALCDAKWLYENTVPRTRVEVIRDDSIVYELSREIIKIDINDLEKRGWDPTDTDPNSPYNIKENEEEKPEEDGE